MNDSSGGIEYTEVDVTPEMAAEWLAHSVVNRNHRSRKSAEYARDITARNWPLTGDAIKFNTKGQLIDGQHRLRAIILSGVTVRMVVARNVPDEAQRVIDSGIARTVADTLLIDGHPHARLLASTARLVVAWKRSQSSAAAMANAERDVTKSEIYDFIAGNPTGIKESVDIATRYQDRSALAVPPSIVGLATYLIAETNGFVCAEEFFRAAYEKVGLNPGDPVLAMSGCFQDYAIKRRHLPSQGQLSVILRCFNARVAGTGMRQIKVKSAKGGLVPVPRVAKIPSDEPLSEESSE